MTTQMIDRYENHLFAELLSNLTVLQEDIANRDMRGLDLQSSFATIQASDISNIAKAYWAIYTISEYLKRPALIYPDCRKPWHKDLWFYYTVTQIEAEVKACMTLVTSELEVAIQDDATFRLAVTYWQLLQILNPKCCPHSEYYLEILYQSPHNWREHWGLTAARIQNQALQYFLGHKPERRQTLVSLLPKSHLFLEILERPALGVPEQTEEIPKPVVSERYSRHIDELESKRSILRHLRGLSQGAQYQNEVHLKQMLNGNPHNLLSVFSSQLTPIGKLDELSGTEFLYEFDAPNKAAFVFDALCGHDKDGYNYVRGLSIPKESFRYEGRNNARYTSITNTKIKQRAFIEDAKLLIDKQIALIEEETRLLKVCGDIEALFNTFQVKRYEMRCRLKSFAGILQERQQAIEYCTDWVEARKRYLEIANELDAKGEFEMLETLTKTIQHAVQEAQSKLGVSVSYKLSEPLINMLSGCGAFSVNLNSDIAEMNQLYNQLTQRDADLQIAEDKHQSVQERFLMIDYKPRIQLPYLSLVALLAALVIITLSLGILAGNPMFTYLVIPMLSEYTATLGIITGLAIGVPSGYSVLRYMLFPPIQETNNQELEAPTISCFCN